MDWKFSKASLSALLRLGNTTLEYNPSWVYCTEENHYSAFESSLRTEIEQTLQFEPLFLRTGQANSLQFWTVYCL